MTFKVEVDAAEVGLDAGRLQRLDGHFAGYVDRGALPGWLVAVTRHGKLAHLSTYGQRDVEAGLPVEPDTLFRIFSMTKPVTSVALMMLYEEGAFQLTDPVSAYIPSFAEARVWAGGSALRPLTVAAREPVRVKHLLMHTSGLTYGFHFSHPADAIMRAKGYTGGGDPDVTLEQAVDDWATVPLLFEPGTEWNYGVSTDVCGRLVEVLSGMPLDQFFASRIFGPLEMADTAFYAREPDRERLAALYMAAKGGTFARTTEDESRWLNPPKLPSGGGGLVSSASDYQRFAEMLRRGGELDGARLLGPRTVAYMTRNHLPGGADLDSFGRPLFSETPYKGVGFGLGFGVVQDPAAYSTLASAGEFNWGGAASTGFWVDPVEDLTVVFMTQLTPSSRWPLRTELRQLLYQAVVD